MIKTICIWKKDKINPVGEDIYRTTCGETNTFKHGLTPTKAGIIYCMHCGKKIRETTTRKRSREANEYKEKSGTKAG